MPKHVNADPVAGESNGAGDFVHASYEQKPRENTKELTTSPWVPSTAGLPPPWVRRNHPLRRLANRPRSRPFPALTWWVIVLTATGSMATIHARHAH
jgi:hypothetical protein